MPITLTAANPTGQQYGYNVTFRDVLPAGVTYVAGSSEGNGSALTDPTIITNPSTGAETLIWSNVGDLSAGSSYPLTFSVKTNTSDYDVGGAASGTSGSFTTNAQVYANINPRYVPQFNSDGTPNGPSSTSFTGESATVPETTTLAALAIKKTGPATLLRGVHDHQGVFNLTVTNNSVNPTDTVTVDDWLPADLEFLGCGGANADNTTNAEGTNPGSPDEYLGSGPIVVPAVANCTTPSSVPTVQTTPPGTDADGNPLPAGVYTHVVWTIGNLAPGQVVTIPYTAAVPIRSNTLKWAAGTTGTATTTTAPASTGVQTANLDNNNGPETYNNEPVVNSSQASGNYQDPADNNASIPTQSAPSVLDGVAKDIIIAKTANTSALTPGQVVTYTLTVNTSEYRFYHDLTVTDVLPNGQCPLNDVANYENQASSACAPQSTYQPSSPYKSVAEQIGANGTNPDGTYTITWDETTDSDLSEIPVNGTATITFPARTLRFYQQNGADDDSTPILSGDSITNNASVSGTDSVRCAGGANAEDCANGSEISHDATTSNGTTPETTGTDAANVSLSSQAPTIQKEVAEALPADESCTDATYTDSTVHNYGPGDKICWRLEVSFPSGTDTRANTLTDFLPAGLSVIPGSENATTSNTVPFSVTESSNAPELTFTLCPTANASGCGPSISDVGPGGQEFEVTFATTEGSPLGHASGDVNGNLMKFSSIDTAGTTVPLRSAADFTFTMPTLGLTKTIIAVGADTGLDTTNTTADAGNSVTYRVAVTNRGNEAASDAVVWDDLPSGETCASVQSISTGGPATIDCVDATTGPSAVPAHLIVTLATVGVAVTTDIDVVVNVPSAANAEPSPGQSFTDTAGVTSYTSTDNLGGTIDYYPSGDLDPTLTSLANAAATNASATVTLPAASLTKTAASAVHEVSTSDATIGEPVDYSITLGLAT